MGKCLKPFAPFDQLISLYRSEMTQTSLQLKSKITLTLLVLLLTNLFFFFYSKSDFCKRFEGVTDVLMPAIEAFIIRWDMTQH